MKFYFLVFQMILCYALSSSAIVHVGNGGGEAENTILQMAPNLGVWAKACNENAGLCGEAVFSAGDLRALTQKFYFASAREIKKTCASSGILIARENLYENLDVAKSDDQLAGILVKTLLVCSGWSQNQLEDLSFSIVPKLKAVTNFSLAVFAGPNSDVIVARAGAPQLQSRLLQSLQCNDYRLISSSGDFLSVECGSGDRKLVLVRKTGTDFEFVSRVDSDDPS